MKKVSLAVALSLLTVAPPGLFALDLDNPLPNWLDTSREKPAARVAKLASTEPPPSDFRFPAEYEPVAAVVISWAGYTNMLSAIAKGVTGPGNAQLWAAGAPASLSGVPAAKYSVINASVDTVWVRDYGPFGLSAKQSKVGIVDTVYRHYQYRTDDDAFPGNLGRIKKINVYGVNLIVDGGNIMVDSKGNLFMTKRTYLWNSSMSQEQVDSLLKNYYKVKNIYSFDYAGYPGQPADGTGHIDMFMKLLNDHTVLISQADTEPFRSTAEKAIEFFKNRTAPDGQPYKVLPIKGWSSGGTWYTYTNSLIVNNSVLMPTYSGHSAEESAAKAAYAEGMKGVTVVGIPADQSIRDGGAVHCVTQTIPVLPSKTALETRAAVEETMKDFSFKTETSPAVKQLESWPHGTTSQAIPESAGVKEVE